MGKRNKTEQKQNSLTIMIFAGRKGTVKLRLQGKLFEQTC